MQPLSLVMVLLVLLVASYYLGKNKALRVVKGNIHQLHSMPVYYGCYAAIWCGVPALLLFCLWVLLNDQIVLAIAIESVAPQIADLNAQQMDRLYSDILRLVANEKAMPNTPGYVVEAAEQYRQLQRTGQSMITLLVLPVAILGAVYALGKIQVTHRARNAVEKSMMFCLIACSGIAIITTLGIVLSVVFESVLFFQHISVIDFIFGLHWSPQTALRADQVGASGAFGIIPLFAGTLLITLIAMSVAAPIGLMSAIYLSEYASPTLRAIAKPLLEVLAGIPTVVYGFFAALTVAPFLRDTGGLLGLDVSSESALAAGFVMGMMIIPFVSSISDDVINAVPQSLRDGALALGATHCETIRKVVIPAALPGVIAGLLLAVSRAIGETMIVAMAAGLSANLTANPLESVTTVTVQIVSLLVGDQEFDSVKTLSAFALGLSLFLMTLILNGIALYVGHRYREQYE